MTMSREMLSKCAMYLKYNKICYIDVHYLKIAA